MTTVVHYVQRWLPLSEQFVHGHVARSRHRGVVVSREGLENAGEFPHRPVHSLHRLVGAPAPVLRAGVLALCLAHRARVVHVHFGYRVHDAAPAAARAGLPLVVSLHGHDTTAFVRQWPHHYDGVLARADAVVVPSRFLAARAVELGARPEAVAVIPAGVDRRRFPASPLPDGAPLVLFVGRFVEKKGLDVLLRAWPEVRRRVPDARLRLLGYGPLANVVGDAPPGVEVQSPAPGRRHQQVQSAIQASTVVVSPSRTGADGDMESLLLVNLEAQSSGRPVVSTRHGGIPEFVEDGRTGILVAENDPVALARALVAVLEDPVLATRLGGAGPEAAARFDAGVSSQRLDDLYEQLTAARR